MSSSSPFLSWEDPRSSHRAMIAIIAVLALANGLFGERVQAGGGLGWDGVTYGAMVRSLPEQISAGTLSRYYAQRILPSTVVGAGLRLVGAELSNENIIRGFELYNLALLLCGVWLWRRMSDDLALGLQGRWVGFCGLFLNFQFSKLVFFYPVLTDATALVTGMLLLHLYLRRRPLALLAAAVVGAFAWPVISYCGALLLAFPRPAPSAEDGERDSGPDRWLGEAERILARSWWIVLGLAVALLALHFLAERTPLRPRLATLVTALPSIVAVLLAGLMLSSWSLLGGVASILRRPPVLPLLLALACLMAPRLVVSALSNPGLADANSVKALLNGIIHPAVGKVFLPFVTLGVVWGPVVLLLVLRWRDFCVQARRLGPGFVAVIALTLLLGLVPEPRFVTAGWPFFVVGAALATERLDLSAGFKYVFGGITILFAQFWLKINWSPWTGGDFDDLLSFPKQLYFLHYGLWMAWGPFLLQLALLSIGMLMLRQTLRRGPAAPGGTERG